MFELSTELDGEYSDRENEFSLYDRSNEERFGNSKLGLEKVTKRITENTMKNIRGQDKSDLKKKNCNFLFLETEMKNRRSERPNIGEVN